MSTDKRTLTWVRRLWILAVLSCVALFLIGAAGYYRKLLVDPFFGSTVQYRIESPAAVGQAFADLGLAPGAYASIVLARQFAIALVSLGLGILVFTRTADRGVILISWLLVALGTLTGLYTATMSDWGAGWRVSGQILNALSTTSSFSLFLVFPDGRFVPRWTRWLVPVFAATAILPLFGNALDDPLLSGLLIAGPGAAMVYAPVYRYLRVSGPVQRQQIKWAVLGLLAGPFVWLIGAFLVPALFPALTQSLASTLTYNLIRGSLNDLAALAFLLAVGLAVLRYRLFDLDLIVRRTLIYAVLTGVLLGVYFGSVVLLQGLFRALTGASQNELVTVISTLTIAALSIPLRQRVQRAIDRRFYRKKYDAAKTLAAFGATARDEVDLGKLSEELVAVVNETMLPENVSLWLRPRDRGPQTTDRSDAAYRGRMEGTR